MYLLSETVLCIYFWLVSQLNRSVLLPLHLTTHAVEVILQNKRSKEFFGVTDCFTGSLKTRNK